MSARALTGFGACGAGCAGMAPEGGSTEREFTDGLAGFGHAGKRKMRMNGFGALANPQPTDQATCQSSGGSYDIVFGCQGAQAPGTTVLVPAVPPLASFLGASPGTWLAMVGIGAILGYGSKPSSPWVGAGEWALGASVLTAVFGSIAHALSSPASGGIVQQAVPGVAPAPAPAVAPPAATPPATSGFGRWR